MGTARMRTKGPPAHEMEAVGTACSAPDLTWLPASGSAPIHPPQNIAGVLGECLPTTLWSAPDIPRPFCLPSPRPTRPFPSLRRLAYHIALPRLLPAPLISPPTCCRSPLPPPHPRPPSSWRCGGRGSPQVALLAPVLSDHCVQRQEQKAQHHQEAQPAGHSTARHSMARRPAAASGR